MKSKPDKGALARLAAVLAVCLAVALAFCAQKSGYFLDEVYTYTLSNSHYAPFPKQSKGGDLVDATFTHEDMLDLLTAQEDERFDVGSVWYNQSLDVHPPLSYLLFNASSSLAPNTFSKWVGLAVNLIFYCAAVVLTYLLGRRLLGDERWALAAALVYGLSQAGLSNMVYIRMYQMLTVATLALALQLVGLRDRWCLGRCLAVGATMTVGLLVQYYFVIYACFASLAYAVWCLRRREGGHLAAYVACCVAGAVLFVLIFPPALSQVGASGGQVSGGGAVQGLLDLASYPYKLAVYGYFLLRGMPVVMAAGVVGLALCGCGRAHGAKDGEAAPTGSLAVCLPAVLDMALVAVISPYASLRYGYNVCPILALCALALLQRGWMGLVQAKGKGSVEGPQTSTPVRRALPVAAAAALSLAAAVAVQPDYLYPEAREYDALLAPHHHAPAVFVSGNSNPSFTSELPRLLGFDDVCVAGDPASPGLSAYVQGHVEGEDLIVFVNTYSGFDPTATCEGLCEALGYSEVQPLYATEWGEAFLLTKGA